MKLNVVVCIQTVFSLESFTKTMPLTEDVIEGWRPKVMG